MRAAPLSNKSLTAIALVCASLLSSTAAHAVDVLGVYRTAAEQDPVIGAAKAAYAATKEQLPQARSSLLPNLGGSVSTSKNVREFPGAIDTNPASPTFGQSYQGQTFNDHGWNAQLRQPIVNVASWFTVGSASASVEAAEYDLAAQEQDLIVRVVQAYLNILRAQDRLDTTNAEITAVKRQLEQVQQRFDVGLVAITDVLESQAAYDNAVVRGIQAEGDYAISFETLSTLTGQSYDALDRLSDELPIVNPDPFMKKPG